MVGGGFDGSSFSATIDFYAFSSNADAADFGDLTRSGNQITACSNSTRGLFAGGNPETDIIDYVTIAATGNAVDFGNLTATIQNPTALANPVRALFPAGEDNPASPVTNRIDYVSIL